MKSYSLLLRTYILIHKVHATQIHRKWGYKANHHVTPKNTLHKTGLYNIMETDETLKCTGLYRMSAIASTFLFYKVPHKIRHTLLPENVNSYFVLQQVLELKTFVPSPSTYALFHNFISERDCTPLQCFHTVHMKPSQQLARTQLMHSMHCGCGVALPALQMRHQ
jgi:hypothetical protein